MKVPAINTRPGICFQGESSKKANFVKTAAGTAVIVLAAAAPAEKANAQYLPLSPSYVQYYVPAPVMNVPRCFIYGDQTNNNYEKNMPDVFNEIDGVMEENGQISVNEAVRLEEANHNAASLCPMPYSEKVRTANLVKNLAFKYNQSGSNPNTINYAEYKNIMNDYMMSKGVADFINLINILSNPHRHHPHHPPADPSPHHHR